MDDPSVSVDTIEARRFARVGERNAFCSFAGRCVGDDVSWKGSEVKRCVSINTAGLGGDMVEWGRSYSLQAFTFPGAQLEYAIVYSLGRSLGLGSLGIRAYAKSVTWGGGQLELRRRVLP